MNVFAFLQVLYAARDAQVSVALFLHLLGFACLPATSKGENSVSGWEKAKAWWISHLKEEKVAARERTGVERHVLLTKERIGDLW